MVVNRRRFVQYAAGGALGTVALGWLTACSAEDTATGETTPDPAAAEETGEGEAAAETPEATAADAMPDGTPALDSEGNPYTPAGVLAEAAAGDRVLAQGLADPVFLVITDGPAIAETAVSAVCPHRQCAVDWDAEAREFVCPCHDSRFDADGKVTQGPATTDLPLIAVATTEEQVLLSTDAP
jgi:cytochrome b6-f complex iron-sulfur subunit